MDRPTSERMIQYVTERIKKIPFEEIPVGIKGGKTGVLLLSSLLYGYCNDPTLLDISQRLFNEMVSYHIVHIFSSTRVFTDGSPGFIWATGVLIRNGLIDRTKALEEKINRILSYKAGFAATPLPANTDDLIFGEAIAEISLLPEEENLVHYTIRENLIKYIDDVERMLEFKDNRIFRLQDTSMTFLLSLVFFIRQADLRHIYPFKTERLLRVLNEFKPDLSKASTAEKTLYAYMMENRFSYEEPGEMTPEQKRDYLADTGLFSVIFNLPSLFEMCLNHTGIEGIFQEPEKSAIDDQRLICVGLGLLNCKYSISTI